MNDDNHLLDALDRRAGVAATDLQARAASRPRPEFDADRGLVLPAPRPVDHGRSWRPLLAVAAVALMLAVVGAGLALRPGEGDNEAAGPAADTPRPFIATDLPDGMRLAGAFDFAEQTSESRHEEGAASEKLDLYGPTTDHPGLGVVTEWPDRSAGDEPAAETIDLEDGRVAEVAENLGLAGTALVFDIETTSVLILSQELDRATLVEIATRARLDGDRVVLDESSLPEGWHLIGTEPDFMGATSPTGRAISPGQPSVMYLAGDDGTGSTAIVSSARGDVLQLNITRLLMENAQSVVVRGHDGLIATAAGGDEEYRLRTLVWLERPGELIRVSGFNVSDQDLRQLAEGVEPVGDDAWEDLLRQSRLGELSGSDGGPPTEPIGEGVFADGTTWVLRKPRPTGEAGDDSVTLYVDTGAEANGGSSSGSSSGSDGGTPRGFLGLNQLQQSDRTFLYGAIGTDVAAVEMRRADGSPLGSATVVEDQGVRAWVIELTEEEAVLVALDAEGLEVDRYEVGDHGATTGHSGQTGSPTSIAPGVDGGISPTTTAPEPGN